MIQLSPHFNTDEMKCSCCGSLPPDLFIDDGEGGQEINVAYLFLLDGLERVRDRWGKPMIMRSWYRCSNHQLSLFRAKKTKVLISVHCFGIATDVDLDTVQDVKDFVKIAKEDKLNFRIGYKRYLEKRMTFVHLDIGWMICPRFSPFLKERHTW